LYEIPHYFFVSIESVDGFKLILSHETAVT
jgi:hypothetical protein